MFGDNNVEFDDEKSDYYIPFFNFSSPKNRTYRLYLKSFAEQIYSHPMMHIDCFHPLEIPLSVDFEPQNREMHKHISTMAKILKQKGE